MVVGVALFVLDRFKCVVRNDFDIYSNINFEFIFVDMHHPNFGKKTVDAIYRPPDSNLDNILIGFESVLFKLNCSKIDCVIAVDYNIDLMRHGSHAGTENYLHILYAHGIIPTITKPTRFGKNTFTLIDNLLINKPSNAFISGLLLTDISNHLPIFYIANSITN